MAQSTLPWRRRLQFSLGGVLALITAISIVLGLYVNRVQRRREVVALVSRHGGAVTYDYQFDRNGKPPGPKWARAWLGDDFFADLIVVRVRGIKTDEPRLSSIGGLKRLLMLELQDCSAGEALFRQFGELTELKRLNLAGTQLSDDGLRAMHRLTRLTHLDLRQTRITDAGLSALRGMTDLEELDLSGTEISDEGLEHLKQLPHLQHLNLAGTRVGDEGLDRLNNMPALIDVCLYGSRVTEKGLATLKAIGTLEGPAPRVWHILKALTDKTELAFARQPLLDVLEYLAERHDIGIVLDVQASASLPDCGATPITANAKGMRLVHALKSILEPLGLTYDIRHEVLFVTASPPRPRMRIEEPADADASSELLAKLEQPATGLQFIDASLGLLLEVMESRYGIAMRVDETSFESEGDKSEREKDEFSEKLVAFRTQGISLRAALELMLDGIGASGRIEGNSLVVAPRKETPADQERSAGASRRR